MRPEDPFDRAGTSVFDVRTWCGRHETCLTIGLSLLSRISSKDRRVWLTSKLDWQWKLPLRYMGGRYKGRRGEKYEYELYSLSASCRALGKFHSWNTSLNTPSQVETGN